MSRFQDIVGQKFNQLTVIQFNGMTPSGSYWLCRCDCGNTCEVIKDKLKSGHTKSCGCLRVQRVVERNKQSATHGLHSHPLYKVWSNMMRRCNDVNSEDYKNYGGRGIKVSAEWQSVANFIGDMDNKPGPEYTLERLDNNANYEKANCCWATREQQNNNRRNCRAIRQEQVILDTI